MSRFSFPFRSIASAGAIACVALAAVMAPWLSIRESVSGANRALDVPLETAKAEASDGRPGNSPAGEVARLVLTPAPAGPRLASSAAAFQAPAPDPASVGALEERLAALSYMMGAKDGVLDAGDRAGLTAFQKVENLSRTGEPDPATLARLDSAARPKPAYSIPPEHLEVDIERQVVFVVRGGQVAHTLPTSTGNGQVFRSQGRRSRAVTPNGQYAITYKREGWRRSPLGMLYRPAYFNGGIAFHGAKSVPTSPASHGCVRLPMAFADWFAEQASPRGMVVYVYGNPGEPNPAPVAAAGLPPEGGAPPGAYDQDTYQPPPSAPPGGPPLLGGILGRS